MSLAVNPQQEISKLSALTTAKMGYDDDFFESTLNPSEQIWRTQNEIE
jgi:hypothetical protein